MATGVMTDAERADFDRRMMLRAVELSRGGEFGASPNPAVGCVIAVGSLIIGEGCHRKFGEGHAEVNAINSVTDMSLVPQATVYVTLEPCSHYGKTPPCAAMLIERGVKRVVIGCVDPNPAVSGRGIRMLREAGIEVVEGICRKECAESIKRFLRATTAGRPYIILKWACSDDGFMDRIRDNQATAARFSTPLSTMAVMRLRASCDAIAVGSATVIADNPSLTVRGFAGKSPARVVFDRRGRVSAGSKVFADDSARCVYVTQTYRPDLPARVDQIEVDVAATMSEIVALLRKRYGWISMIVEGGPTLLRTFIGENLCDECRVEITPFSLGRDGAAPSPAIPPGRIKIAGCDGNRVVEVRNNDVF